MGPQHGRFAPEQFHAPGAVSHVAEEGQPGGTAGVLSRHVVVGENPDDFRRNRNQREPELALRQSEKLRDCPTFGR